MSEGSPRSITQQTMNRRDALQIIATFAATAMADIPVLPRTSLEKQGVVFSSDQVSSNTPPVTPTPTAEPEFNCTHKVQDGENPSKIATDHRISLQQFQEHNWSLQPDLLHKGDEVNTPCVLKDDKPFPQQKTSFQLNLGAELVSIGILVGGAGLVIKNVWENWKEKRAEKEAKFQREKRTVEYNIDKLNKDGEKIPRDLRKRARKVGVPSNYRFSDSSEAESN